MDGKPELVAAAPWVSPLIGAEEEEKKKKNDKKKAGDGKEEEEEGMWTGFKHKIYEPTTAPSSDDKGKTSWKQWDLERKNVDENLQAAITASGMRPKSSSAKDDHSSDVAAVHGIPGGALFWPLEEGHTQDPAHPKAKRPSSKNTRSVPPALVVEAKKDEAFGLGLQVPSHQAALTPTPDIKCPKWNEETQRWKDYLSPLPPLSRAASARQQQRLPGLDAAVPHKTEDKGNDDDDDGETTPKASQFAGVQQGEQIIQADTGFSASSSTSAVKHGAEGPSRKENQGAQPSTRKTYSPSSYTTSPPTTIGSSFLSYYGHTPPQEPDKPLSGRASQSLRPALPEEASSAEEKHRSAWLALNGLEDEDDYDEEEDLFPLPPQPLFGTRNTTGTPVFGAGGTLSANPKEEGTTLSPRRRTIIHHDSPYSSTPKELPSPRGSSASAEAAQKDRNIPATPVATHLFPPRLSSLSPIPQPQDLSPAISESQSRSPASAILSMYGSLTPPDTATTYRTDTTVFTPSPSFPLSSHTPPTRPAPTLPPKPPIATPPPTAIATSTTTTTKPSTRHLPRVFSTSPLNHPPSKNPLPQSKSHPRGLGIGIAGLAGPEPAIGLEEAMRVRARREEEGRREAEREETERREVEEEYREWMRRVEEEEEEEVGGEGGEMLLPRVFEGFGVRKDVKKGKGKGVGEGAKAGGAGGMGEMGQSGAVGGKGESGPDSKGKGKMEEEDDSGEEERAAGKDAEEEWLRMAKAFHDSHIT